MYYTGIDNVDPMLVFNFRHPLPSPLVLLSLMFLDNLFEFFHTTALYRSLLGPNLNRKEQMS